MAHDFNNALQVLAAGIESIGDELRPDSRIGPELVADMKLASTAALGLARRLVNLGHSGPVASDVVELQSIIDEAAAMTKRMTDQTTLEIS